jgi:hypothetical protein
VREGDVEMREGLVQELGQAADCLDQVARLAMAALLQVRCLCGVSRVRG